jgi:ABC-type Fe3+ transport system permease subunit
VVKELPLALLLAPIGFDTLATEIWDAASSGFYARAAVPAGLLLGLSVATVALLPFVCLPIILLLVRETRGEELEHIAS